MASPPSESLMKILLASNAPWASTGYGTQTASLARRLRDDGHKVVIYCQYGLQGGVQEWEGITCLPTGMEGGYADPIIRGHLRYTQPDLLITFFDLWALHKTPIPKWIQDTDAKWLAYFPIDAVPVSRATREVLGQVDYPVVLSNFAEAALKEWNPEYKVAVIPHGIEKSWGYTANGRKEFRRSIQVPDDAFLFGTVGRNAYYPGRKGLDRLVRAFAELELDNTYLYIHTGTWSENGSVPIEQMTDFYTELHPYLEGRVKLPDDYNLVMGYSQTGMNALYSALDCYVQPTLGEGFGLPVMEAQACGAAVIATDCTSMPDIVAPHSSVLVPGATELFTPDPSHRVLIDIPKLKDAMTEIYDIKTNDLTGYQAMKANAGLWANGFDWDRIWTECWKPLLAEIGREIELAPRRDWHRGGAVVYEHEGRMRKRESFLKAPVVAKTIPLMEKVAHPNIIPILAKGVENGLHWLDMPKYTALRDVDLSELAAEQKDRIIDGVRAALEHMHGLGYAHRDVAPENVVVDDEYNPYLIDFEWAHPCDGEIGVDCVDFEPWACVDRAVAIVQTGMEERGFHTIVNYVNGLSLEGKTHGFKGVPYQQVNGTGERDCQVRWDIMKPDVKGKTVLDLGSNLGWFCRKAVEEGAEKATGVENDNAVVESARALTNGHNIEYIETDLMAWEPETYDVGFALSVLQHLPDPDPVMDKLMESCDEVYVEIPQRFITNRVADYLQYGQVLGESERGRPVYRVRQAEVPRGLLGKSGRLVREEVKEA